MPKQPCLDPHDLTEIETLVNAAIHELVFALHHADDDQFEDAETCFVQVAMNLDRIHEILQATRALALREQSKT